jgi:hypothetical protein
MRTKKRSKKESEWSKKMDARFHKWNWYMDRILEESALIQEMCKEQIKRLEEFKRTYIDVKKISS